MVVFVRLDLRERRLWQVWEGCTHGARALEAQLHPAFTTIGQVFVTRAAEVGSKDLLTLLDVLDSPDTNFTLMGEAVASVGYA